jgi:hypothetical protein
MKTVAIGKYYTTLLFYGKGAFGQLRNAIKEAGKTSQQQQYWDSLWPDIKNDINAGFDADTSMVAALLKMQCDNTKVGWVTLKPWSSLYLVPNGGGPAIQGSDAGVIYGNDKNDLAIVHKLDKEELAARSGLIGQLAPAPTPTFKKTGRQPMNLPV